MLCGTEYFVSSSNLQEDTNTELVICQEKGAKKMTDKKKIMIYVNEELKKRIEQEAKKENRSMSNYIINIIKEKLKEE